MSRGPSGEPASGLIIVNHNTKGDLLACLETAKTAGADHVVVVDCGSTDGSLTAVARSHPWVIRVALPNLGFGRGVNAGVRRLDIEQPSDVIVVANADTRFEPEAVRDLATYLRANPDVGAAGPRVVFPDGRLQFSARSFPDISTALGHALFGLLRPTNRWTRRYRLTDWDHESPRDVDWLSGCCVAFNAAAFDEAGGFDPAYFMFVEDVDLCWRLGQLGWRVTFAPVTQVTHAIGASVGSRRTRMVLEHARSLDRFFDRRYSPGLATRLLIRLGLLGWAVSVIVWSRMQGRTHAQAA
ncbi:glycosyltransferase family 2 protein [Euzebya tangerina]|uniref:glycosyltransferase family 2 protein n=1 Tax=Euzebya tangerina TaxID=591198 RepID=UPI000E31C17F|nr:glycosyltransferase family 2 protein [Euzebya tangerina]